MRKRILAGVLALAIMLIAVPIVLGATTAPSNPQIAQLQQQLLDLKKQLVQKYVENGQLTADQGKLAEQRMDDVYKYAEQNGFQPGPGLGGICGGGCGRMGGRGPGAVPQSFNSF